MNAPLRHTSMRTFVRSVLEAAINGTFDERLLPKAAATGVGEGLGSAGGFLMPTEIANEIWSKVYSSGRIITACTKQPVTRASGIKMPAISEASRADGSRLGGVRSYFLDEGQQVTASKPKFDLLDFELRKLLTLIYATDELVDDVPGLAAFLERIMSLEVQFTLEDKVINGSGAGAPLGVVNSGALITVAAEGGQTAATVVYANLQKMAARLWGPSHATAMWLMGNEVYQQIEGLQSSVGIQLFELGTDGRRYMFQIPVELSEYTAALGNTADLLLCDFSQYLIADQDAVLESSIHVQYVTDETAFKLRYRVEGQPAWRTPITPKNSAVTQSPFIALAARP